MELKSLKPHTIFFDTARFKHPEFNKIMRGINELIKCGGTVPVINCLVGPSRVGKSVVISSVCKQYENHINTEHQPIVNIDIEGTVATVRLESDNWSGHKFTDLFTLLKLENEWKIMNKVFHLHK